MPQIDLVILSSNESCRPIGNIVMLALNRINVLDTNQHLDSLTRRPMVNIPITLQDQASSLTLGEVVIPPHGIRMGEVDLTQFFDKVIK